MKLPSNRVERAQTGHISSFNEASSTGNRLHLIKFWSKGVPGEPPNNPNGSPQTDSKALLLKTTTTQQLTEQKEVKLVPVY